MVLSYGTAYYSLKADQAIFELAVRALAEGNALRATARIVQVDKDMVCAWFDRAAHHCLAVMLSLWYNLHVRECQLDELWSFVHTKETHLSGTKLYCATYGEWYQPKRQGARGAYPKRRRMPLPGLIYAQVVKQRATGRVVGVSTHVVCGTREAVAACLAASPLVRR
jgi:hypothetical protein